jgi:RNA polymerase sigma-70 factor, ECF subfamily
MKDKLFLLASSNFEALNPNVQKEIYHEFYKMVYPIIIYMVKDHALTEDVIQESFLKVVYKMPAIDDENKLKAWIKVVVKNCTYNLLRKTKKNRNEIDSDRVYLYDNLETYIDSVSTESVIESKFMSETIKKYLKELKPEYQALLELRWHKQLSYKEIAETLDTAEETVKYKLHRAREVIKKKFQKEWGDPR